MITINVDLGTAIEVKVLVIYDHNLSATATITLKGVEPTIFSEAVPWTEDNIIHYLSVATTKRYWHLQITDDNNTDLYIDIGDIFLGSYMELSKTYSLGFSKGFKLLYDANRTPYGVVKKRFYNRQRSFEYNFNLLIVADITLLEAMIDSIASRSTGQLKPFWFNNDSAIPAQTWMVDVSAIPEDHRILEYYKTSLKLLEVMKSI